MKRHVIITAKVHNYFINALQNRGYTIMNAQNLGYDDLYKVIEQAFGIIVTTRIPIDKNMIDKATNLPSSIL